MSEAPLLLNALTDEPSALEDIRSSSRFEVLGLTDPLADLMFSCIAIFILLLMAVPPQSTHVKYTAAQFLKEKVEIGGVAGVPILVLENGVRLPGTGELVLLDNIPDSASLRLLLRTAMTDHLPVIEVIAPDGLEAGFQLESALSKAGLQSVISVHVGADCRISARGDVLELCSPV